MINVDWTLKYMNIPFLDNGRDFSGIDCYGLIRLIYKEECNMDLPVHTDWSCAKTWAKLKVRFKSQFDVRNAFVIDENTFADVIDGNPKRFDILVFYDNKKRVAEHLGLHIGGDRFIHIFDGSIVTISRFEDFKDKLFVILRYSNGESNI